MRIQLLGPLLIDGRNGSAVVPAAKQRVLMAALALRTGHVVSFEALADAAWGDDVSLAARVTVRNYMLRLRRALGDDGPRIVTRDPGYLLDVADGDVDALAFDCQCEAGAGLARSEQWDEAAETLREALRMWRGTPLADVPSGPLRDHWVRYLEQVRLRALRQRIRADLQVGRHEAVTGELWALTAAHPLDEGLWGLLLLALYRSGQQGGALAAYRQARATLVAELGVEPGPDLRRLHAQLLAHDPSLDVPTALRPRPSRLTISLSPPLPAVGPEELVDRGQAMTWLAAETYAVQKESNAARRLLRVPGPCQAGLPAVPGHRTPSGPGLRA
jgi:DNA-binding SARP family transcriptional activator